MKNSNLSWLSFRWQKVASKPLVAEGRRETGKRGFVTGDHGKLSQWPLWSVGECLPERSVVSRLLRNVWSWRRQIAFSDSGWHRLIAAFPCGCALFSTDIIFYLDSLVENTFTFVHGCIGECGSRRGKDIGTACDLLITTVSLLLMPKRILMSRRLLAAEDSVTHKGWVSVQVKHSAIAACTNSTA